MQPPPSLWCGLALGLPLAEVAGDVCQGGNQLQEVVPRTGFAILIGPKQKPPYQEPPYQELISLIAPPFPAMPRPRENQAASPQPGHFQSARLTSAAQFPAERCFAPASPWNLGSNERYRMLWVLTHQRPVFIKASSQALGIPGLEAQHALP